MRRGRGKIVKLEVEDVKCRKGVWRRQDSFKNSSGSDTDSGGDVLYLVYWNRGIHLVFCVPFILLQNC